MFIHFFAVVWQFDVDRLLSSMSSIYRGVVLSGMHVMPWIPWTWAAAYSVSSLILALTHAGSCACMHIRRSIEQILIGSLRRCFFIVWTHKERWTLSRWMSYSVFWPSLSMSLAYNSWYIILSMCLIKRSRAKGAVMVGLSPYSMRSKSLAGDKSWWEITGQMNLLSPTCWGVSYHVTIGYIPPRSNALHSL